MTATATPEPDGHDAVLLAKQLRMTFESGRTRPIAWRKQQLAGLRALLTEREDELLEALRLDLGRPRMEALSADVGHTKGEIRHLFDHLERWARPTKVRAPLSVLPAKASTRPEPLGVALVIAPWNYPIQLFLEPIAAALAAGNCVAAKPSELAPACSAAMARLVPLYVDPDALVVVEGGVAETTALLAQRWDHIFFTGSTAVGRIVAAAAAKHLTPTTLELGGKSPAYVHASADLDVAARRIAWGKFLNAGQTCIAPDYVLADRSIQERLIERLAAQITAFYGENPRSSPSYGRIVNARHLERLHGLLDRAGTVVVGGQFDAADGYFAPTVTVDPEPNSQILQEEIFGPILPVLAVDGPDQAAVYISARPKPLALYIFAEDSAVVEQVISATSSGGVCVNHTIMHLLPPNLPFGGVGDSGMGSYHGKAGFDAFSHHRSVLAKPSKPDPRLLYPPYKPLAERIVRWVAR